MPTPTRNLLNEFKEAVKEIEKQVVKADNQAENQVNLANQLNGGNIDSLTKQISYLQNALKNSTKDAPTPSTATKEVDSLSEATPNLTQNSIKGDGFVISGNGVEPKSDLSVKISVDEWVKELAGINPNKQIIADLEHLYEKHKELFSKPSEVFKLIKAVKDNPTFFYTNNQPNIALIGSILENGKLGKIGIQKDFDSDNLQVRHATYSSNAKKENERLLKRNSYPVGSPTPTQLTFGKTAEPTANGAKALLGKKEKAVSGDALPPHLDADNISLTGRYSVGGKPHLTAVDENIIPQNAKNEVKEQTKSTQINEQAVKTKAEPITQVKQETQAKAQTTATQPTSQVKEPTDDRKYFKNLDSEEYKKISNPYLSRTIKNGSIKTLIDNGFDDYDYNHKVKKEILDFIKLDKDLYKYYRYQEKYREVDYIAETFRMIHYDISSLSTRANIWAQDFSDKYLMAKYKLTNDELAKVRAKWNDSLAKNKVISITHIKEFGTNYAEFYHAKDLAIKKLLTERQGQVAGAFHKDGLGDIDLVWGNEKMGLAHILSRRSEQWGEEKAIRFIKHLAENIEKGTINAGKNGRTQINTELTTIVIDKNKDNRFILTAYRDKNNKKMSLENAKLVQSSTITDKGIETNAKDSSVLSSNQQPNSTTTANKSQEPNLSRAERRAMGIEEPKGKTLAQYRKDIEAKYNITPIKEFGTNYAEFYHDGKGAIDKLLAERQGQVAGAFYDERFGDVGIVWGVEGTGKSDGWGIAKIAKYHPEALDKMEEMLKMPIIAQSENRIKLSDGKYFMSIRKDFNGEKQNWILTAFEKEENKSVSGRRTNLSATQSASEKTTSQNTHTTNSTPKEIKSQEPNLSRAERRAMGIEEPKGKTLVIDEKAVKNDVREFGRLADQVGLGFKSAKEAKAVMDKCDKSKFDCGS
ncbi:hypothetical protein [Campylobacter lanienae]|uniref:putative barnase/colicin E5 family endoribonuclease n=1 Tax=Campylobacter lanienae TaxID=75658 RepID=UPI00242E609C|nr:hypothetical protein [Campylobacter lanienae]